MFNHTRWIYPIAIFLFQSNALALDSTEERPSQRFLNAPKLSESNNPPPIIAPAPVVEQKKGNSIDGESIYLKTIQIEGNTVFSADELGEITRHYENKKVTADDLRQLRQDLTVHYIQNGYINSGAILPQQSLENGELRVQIVEGKLTEIQIEGLNHLQEFYLQSRIETNETLNIKNLQNSLQLLQQNPLISRINAELLPNLKQGEAILRTTIEEATPYFVNLGINNNGVPSVGAERFELTAGHRNLFGIGDAFNGNFTISEGQTQYAFDYGIPFTPWDTTLNLRYQNSEADVIEKPFKQLNIFNQSETFGIGISQPIWRTVENQITLGLMAERRHSEAFLQNEPYSFSRGSVNGANNVSVLRFSQDWLNRTDNHVLALRSVANFGVDALDATIHTRKENLPDGRYFFWLGQTQWIQRLWETGVEMHLQGNTQLSTSPLLSLEQFALGGMNSVRGYRKNEMVRDNGFSGTLEFRVPIMPSLIGKNTLQIAPFFDFGRAWYNDIQTPSPQTLASLGIGFHANPIKQIHLEFYWAQPLRKVSNTGNDLQDSGINFAVNYSPF